MNKKEITVTKPFMPALSEYIEYVEKIWNNCWVTNKGPLFKEFHLLLQNYLSVDNLSLTVNGHSALDISIKVLGLSGEVITTPFTFASTAHALTMNHIKPVFCDIKESDLTIDESKIEELITDKTTAIMPVHVYGHSCNTEAIEKIAKKHHLKVIYDAAHSFGVQKNGQSIALCGDVSVFSFHATKIFHTIEGGCAIYRDSNLEPLFNAFRNFGIYSEEEINYIGGNAKMNEFQAAMGIVNLKHMDEIIRKRKKLTLYYRKKLDLIEGIRYFVPEKMSTYSYNYAYFPVLIDENKLKISRDDLYEKLKKFNIYTRKYFYPLVTDFGCYSEQYRDVYLPVAKKVSEQILCLPLYYDLSYEDIDYICQVILELKKVVE